MDRFQKRLQEASDAAITSILCGTSTVPAPPQVPLTLDRLRSLMTDMPAKETWLSSRDFPADKALVVKGQSENFTAAHPDFWTRLHARLRDEVPVVSQPTVNPLFGFNITPINVDPEEEDDADRLNWKRAQKVRFGEAMLESVQPLPDILRTPRFSTHG